MTADSLRAFALSGPMAPAALDWLHVHADVRGVVEEGDSTTVFLIGALPPLRIRGVTVCEVAIDARPVTGLENDAIIVVADDLIVRPPWVEAPGAFTGVELVVPRGNAFGSGEHDSTQAALRCLHALWNAPASCVDVGTGSGILALYATVRGCADVQACDIEGPAVEAARALLPGASVTLGGPGSCDPAECVVANMTGAELGQELPAILALWQRAGPLVLGGMRDDECEGIRSRLPAEPSHIERRGAFTALGVQGAVR